MPNELYLWGLDKNRMPIVLVKMDTTAGGVMFIPVPEVLYNNDDVWYVVPEVSL